MAPHRAESPEANAASSQHLPCGTNRDGRGFKLLASAHLPWNTATVAVWKSADVGAFDLIEHSDRVTDNVVGFAQTGRRLPVWLKVKTYAQFSLTVRISKLTFVKENRLYRALKGKKVLTVRTFCLGPGVSSATW
ncbi:hypothetical protein [Pseudomonas nitroreducens]|uniref:hypothetical protein n=1 Tax=Pseudomonas nitroreducens TaxID=46680 RepID=UPI003CC81A6F